MGDRAAVREDEVREIASIDDAVARNQRITATYRRLSRELCVFIGGPFANWCTYAVWSSRTVGGALAGRDLPVRAIQLLHRAIPDEVLRRRVETRLRAALPRTRSTYAVPLAEGNRDIFVEVGTAVTRFLARFADDVVADPARLDDFLGEVDVLVLGPGTDDAAPALLREGLRHYYEARFAATGDERSELVLAGSLLVGAYEQRRVQDHVARSFAIGVAQALGPLARIGPLRLAATPVWARLMTRRIMSLVVDGDVIALGRPIAPPPGAATLYPATLAHVDSPVLAELLRRYDREPGRPVVARDWSDYDDRMRFITAFFRSRQQEGALFRDADLAGEW